MKQIEGTVNSCLGQLVGAGLIIFFGFMFLMTSAQLSKSILGDLLAQAAGETAKTARYESFTFWGKVGQEVASGIGYSGGEGPLTTSATPMAVAATAIPPTPIANPTSQPTTSPVVFVRDGPYSLGGLKAWRGVDTADQPLLEGVLLPVVQQSVDLALKENSGDLLALWLQNKAKACEPDYRRMVTTNYASQNPADTQIVRTAAQKLVDECNPRMYIAYAYKRWADLADWGNKIPHDENAIGPLLAGLQIQIVAKAGGPERAFGPSDPISVTVLAPYPKQYFLANIDLTLMVDTLDKLKFKDSGGKWAIGQTLEVDGNWLPSNPGLPIVPSEAELTPPVSAAPAATASTAAAQKSLPPSGKYVVQSGDTIYGIARKFNVTVDSLVAANQNTPGFNAFYPDIIVPGQELIIPTH